MEKNIPTRVFNAAYPDNPRTFGQALRKARIDAGLEVKELAEELGVNERSVINWEIHGMMPRYPEKVLGRFPQLSTLPFPRLTSLPLSP